jgi:defect-in-organelle-trafficking protein DotB
MIAADPLLIPLNQDDLQYIWEPGHVFQVPSAVTPNVVDDLLVHAYRSNTSDINITTGDYIWFDYHGRMIRASNRPMMEMDVEGFVRVLTDASKIGSINSGQPLNRAIEVKPRGIRNTKYRFRLNGLASTAGAISRGIQLTMRTIPATPLHLSTLGIEPAIQQALFPQNGMVLVCGTTNSGKTTLLFAVLREIAEKQGNRKIITAEDPPEFTFEGVQCAGVVPTQIEIQRDVVDYLAAIKETTRRSADVQLIGETRNAEEFRSLLEVSNQGIATYSTLHTGTADGVVRRVLDSFSVDEKPAIAASFLENIRLIVCAKLLINTKGTRTQIREWIVVDRELREVLSNLHFTEWTRVVREEVEKRGQAMRQQAFWRLKTGEISREVFIEAFGETPEQVEAQMHELGLIQEAVHG